MSTLLRQLRSSALVVATVLLALVPATQPANAPPYVDQDALNEIGNYFAIDEHLKLQTEEAALTQYALSQFFIDPDGNREFTFQYLCCNDEFDNPVFLINGDVPILLREFDYESTLAKELGSK